MDFTQASSLVSIIIPCYNAEPWVGEAIQSALDQSYSPIEVIVIDDGSMDKSLEVIKSFGNKIRWESGPNRGACAARNRGLDLANGIYIKFLDADDILLPHCIKRQVELSEARGPNVLVFGGRGSFNDSTHSQSADTQVPVTEKDDLVEYLLKTIVNTPCILYRKALIQNIGGFNINLKNGQEYELHLRLALAGIKFHSDSDLVCLVRIHSSEHRISIAQTVRNAPDSHINLLRLTQEHIGKRFGDNIPMHLRILLGRNWWSLGREMFRVGHPSKARICFKEATLITKKKAAQGSLPYRMMATICGPLLTEAAFEAIKSVRRRLSFNA